MEREDSEEGFFDTIWNFFYGPPKRKKKDPSWQRGAGGKSVIDDSDTIPAAPQATSDQLLSVLHVTNVDLNIINNTRTHNTDKYACTKSHVVGGSTREAELVVRRGLEFCVTVTFDRSYDVGRDDIRFAFKTGELPDINPATNGMFVVHEGGSLKFDPDKWDGYLKKQTDTSIDVVIHIPANCAIGEWSVCVDTRTITEGKKTKTFRYEHPDDLYVLFNPWCEDDETYMPDTDTLKEYVLNDHGCVYKGNAYHPKPKDWNIGQYEEGILEASLYIIGKCLKPKQTYQLSDPVKVARLIAQVVNSNDADKGVLYGKWDGKYSDGDNPSDWYGSVRILRQYMDTRKPVKYGQCWVFSGVTTTVCRAVGLAARSVTTYNSAHDTDESNTIDIYYSHDDNNELVRNDSSDSIWNYHVWNEVWMRRSDIRCSPEDEGKFDGWQVIDATPQERSDGVFTCGPCPVYAVKHGFVNTLYDTAFVFAEVNADECHWEPSTDSYKRFKLSIDKVGKSISTKKADGKPFDSKAWFDTSREDITDSYKFPEESESNRRAVMRAALGARRPKSAYEGQGEKEDVEFKLVHMTDLPLGKDIEVTLTATNKSEYRRTLELVTFRFIIQSYNGNLAPRPFKIEQIREKTELAKDKEYKFTVTLKHRDYLPEIDDGRCISIQAYAFIQPTRSRPMQNCVKAHTVEFGAPVLDVKLPAHVELGQEFEAVVTFNNPLEMELTECKAGYEGGGFPHVTSVKQDNVPVLGTHTGKFQLTGTTEGMFTLTFKFTSKQLQYLSGSAQIEKQYNIPVLWSVVIVISDTIPAAPQATSDQLLSVLHVTNVDLNIINNTRTHNTDKYACTKSHVVGGSTREAELVVRRGLEFCITVTFDRSYDVGRDDIRFAFKTGELPDINPATNGMFVVHEGGSLKFDPDKWDGYLKKQTDTSIDVVIHIPANCAIGEWSVCVDTRTITEGKKTKTFRYEHPDDLYVLFNPWCEDDETYMPDTDTLKEYVLNDHGCVYKGNAYHPKPKDWNIGQYEEGILEASLYIIGKCLKPKQTYQLSDPVKVARLIAQVVNSNDADKGVLYGKWDGNYSDGDSPSDWYGSVRILRQYMDTRKPVKYGQCWVFSGVTTTVCRAVGLAARSLTTYNSAHDTDESNTIDIYYSHDDNNELVRDDSSDSIWNYHVWNEVWMRRSDIRCSPEDEGKFDGWQVIDATPQERSDGVFTCGPCPVYAVKHGFVNTLYDTAFVFAEVNADECHWEPSTDSYKRFKLSIDKVGKSISTKKADGKPFDSKAWFDTSREDITDSYKFPEESESNRRAVMRAALGARRPKSAYEGQGEKEDVEFKLVHMTDLPLGKDIEVTLTATNKSEYRRTLELITFRFIIQSYNGNLAPRPFKIEQIREKTELAKDKEYRFPVTLKHRDYLPEIDDGRCISIQAYAFIQPTRSRPMQNCVKAHTVEFGAPVLDVKLPAHVELGQEFEAVVTFNNPLEMELTECKAGYEGGGFPHVTSVKQGNVPVLGTHTGKFQLTGTTEGMFTLTFKFTSKQLQYLSGSAQIEVKHA